MAISLEQLDARRFGTTTRARVRKLRVRRINDFKRVAFVEMAKFDMSKDFCIKLLV